jgi:FKBP-type peptidyl-prolyl cis-trans isomerase FkpA/FKBP-type peptidyl-prolyl cis-trans isomerase FklB
MKIVQHNNIKKMKRTSLFVMILVAVGMIVTSCGNGISTNVGLKSDVDSAYYAIGVNYGSGLREGLKTLPGAEGQESYDALIAGFAAALKDEVSKLKMTPENAQMFIQTYVESASRREAEKTKAEGEAFLAANKTKPGVITTESGFQYKVIKEGTGKKPTENDRVIVHYTGRLIDGTEFESSLTNGEPATFGLMQVIRGWSLGLQIMPVGSKYIFWFPSELAYGEQQVSQLIKANSVLEFELELLGIEE